MSGPAAQTRPSCPECRATKPKANGIRRAFRWWLCRVCGARFKTRKDDYEYAIERHRAQASKVWRTTSAVFAPPVPVVQAVHAAKNGRHVCLVWRLSDGDNTHESQAKASKGRRMYWQTCAGCGKTKEVLAPMELGEYYDWRDKVFPAFSLDGEDT